MGFRRVLLMGCLSILAACGGGAVSGPKQCFVGGCSGQICSEQEGVASTCEWTPAYACYASATCAVQADGNCGWNQTAELLACLSGSQCQGTVTCKLACQYGWAKDDKGCDICQCAPKPPFCGGIAGIQCAAGKTCVDDPADDCDPTKGGADCGGICVDKPNGNI